MDGPPPPPEQQHELSVLGKILLDPTVIDSVAVLLDIQDFHTHRYQQIYSAMLMLSRRGIPVTENNLLHESRRLRHDPVLEIHELAALVTGTPHEMYAESDARIVKDFAIKRAIQSAASEVLALTRDPTLNGAETASRAEEILTQVGQNMLSQTQMDELSTEDEIRASHQRLSEGVEIEQDICTGFTDVDGLVGGFRNQSLIVVGARAGVGKTSIMADIALHAMAQQKKVMIFSLEMSRPEIIDRMMCAQGRLPLSDLRAPGYRSSSITERLGRAMEFMLVNPPLVDDRPNMTVDRIFSLAKRAKRRDQVDMVCVDYVQLIRPRDLKISRQEQVAEMARAMKLMAKTLDIPVMLLAQLNRASEAERNGIPKLYHLRESGAIEQDADMVLLIHRPRLHENGQETTHAERAEAKLIVAKNRNGPVGSVELTFVSQSCSFENAARERDEPASGSEPDITSLFTDEPF